MWDVSVLNVYICMNNMKINARIFKIKIKDRV